MVHSWYLDLQDISVCFRFQVAVWANDGDAVFIREFTLIRRDHLPEEPLHDQKPEDPVRELCTSWICMVNSPTSSPA